MRLLRIIALLFGSFLLVLLSLPGQAQEIEEKNKNYLLVGAGVASLQELATRLGNSFTLFFPVSRRVERAVGPLQVGYLREVDPKWKVGAISSYTYLKSISFHHTDEQGEAVKTRSGEERLKVYTLMPTVEHTWARSEIVQLYSGVSLGLLVTKVEERSYAENTTRHRSKAAYLGHLNLLGLRVGKQVGVYLEGGFGVHGLVSGGMYGTW
ncbi:hypothetical protein TH63_10905 [Rufibacter radiotolerans]|uniref:Outer membrane protein beta-barrel domain n=1 Tax=Rufibacter radiotolerans TaxID=1379910 RepID=A0A0H4VQK4_9BACT|nr:hypothetical protein [Rufibacter radiotolerans]AKQ46034.1 hypothetical protein TH63_10905 [Rufibacter radiotolerans]